MAVVKVKKVYLIAHDSMRETLVKVLQKNGLLHIVDLKKELSETELEEVLKEFEPDSEEIDLMLSKVNFTLDFLADFAEKEKGFLSGFKKEKTEVEPSKFENIQDKVNLEKIYEECESFEVRLNVIETGLNKLEATRNELKPWMPLDIKFMDIGETKRAVFIIGQVVPLNFSKLQVELEETVPESVLEIISKGSQHVYVLGIYLKDRSDEVGQILNKYGFQATSFENLDDAPEEEAAEIAEQIGKLREEKETVIKRVKDMMSLKSDLIVLRDYLENVKNRVKVQLNFAKTDKAFMLEGWIHKEDVSSLENEISKFTDEIDLTFIEPNEDENPPVTLKNNKWFTPFEIVTKLYGFPRYKELDPTPYLAPFFIVFFGICIGDVGYGLILSLASLWMRKKLQVSETIKGFLMLFIYGGIASMVAGALTGSWFTIETKFLPSILRKMIVLEPLKDPVTFLVFCFIFGFIHLLFGIVLEMYDNFRKGRWVEGIFKEGSKLVFLPGVVILIVQMLAGGAVPQALSSAGKWMAIVGMILIVWFTDPSAKSIFGRIGNGVYGLYGMTSFIGDTISYSRLMALGMATFLIGWGINIIGGIAKDMIPFVGFIVMAIILVVGHLFNLVINLISAFVHPARLQYVEFFGKFFEGGGHSFQPFAIEAKDLVFKEPELARNVRPEDNSR